MHVYRLQTLTQKNTESLEQRSTGLAVNIDTILELLEHQECDDRAVSISQTVIVQRIADSRRLQSDPGWGPTAEEESYTVI